MKSFHLGISLLVLGTALGGRASAQTTTQPAQAAPSTTTQPATATSSKPATTKRKAAQTQRIPIESTPGTPATPATAAQETQQKAQDARLLQQQQAQSAAAAQVTNTIVDKAQKQQDKAQSEVRIQDAPGPAQTGVVPAAGAPVLPAPNTSQDIQDAPGPAQTLAPAQPATQPVPQPTVPSANPPL